MRKLGQLAVALAACVVCAVSASDCGFPEYDFRHAAAGGSAGGSAGAGGDSGAAGSGGDAGALGGTAGSAAGGGQGGGGTGGHGGGGTAGQSGVAGEAGAAGAAGAACVFPPPVAFPAHCFNGSVDSDETGSNCGGSCAPCSGTQACKANSDCASNTCTSLKCSQSVNLAYQNVVSEAFTSTPKFNLLLTYLEQTPMPLGDLRVRYYFNHHGVAEPVVALHTQAQLNTGNSQPDISRDMRSQVYRLPLGPTDARGIVTDSYLEITFANNTSLAAGWSLSLAVEIDAGSFELDSQFQQALNYSFIAGGPLENDWITVYRKDQLLWGVPPPLSLLPDCAFVAGVNLHGPALTVDTHPLQASSSASVAYSGATFDTPAASTLLPVTDPNTSTLLHTGFALGNASATWSVPNGKYRAYAWLSAGGSTNSGRLSLQGNPVDRFSGLPSGGVGWARIGPYAIDVLDGSVKLSGTGTLNLAGVELYDVPP